MEAGQNKPDEPVVLEALPQWEVEMSPNWSGKLIEALAKAQLKFKPVLKQNENAAFTRGNRISYYADLATYIDATQAALAEQGLVVTQWPDVAPEAKSMSLVSFLMHSSGEWMRGRLTLPATGRDGFTPQSCGSSITYARRYSYAAITGCASEDDDGNAASGKGTAEAAQQVGQAKIDALKAKAKAAEPVQLCCYPAGEEFEVTGDSEVMEAHKELLLHYGKRKGREKVVTMTAENLDAFRHEFVEVRHGILANLKGVNGAKAAVNLKESLQ